MNPLTEAEATTLCTGGHADKYFTTGMAHTFTHLPCGCQDVHYADGTICYEHAHVECDATPKETR